MDHLGGDIDRALAADENNAPPVPLLHAGQIRTAQAHAAEHVDLEEPPPFLVGNIPERLWLENAEVVHENVHEREPLELPYHSIPSPALDRDSSYEANAPC